MTDPRDLIQRLADELEDLDFYKAGDLIAEARTYLAQPEPEGATELTDQELLRCFKIATPCYNVEGWRRELDGMRAAIAADRARYGNRTPAPIPLSERQPTEADCDAEGRCWWWDDDDEKWVLHTAHPRLLCWVIWLPHWALPVPGQEVSE